MEPLLLRRRWSWMCLVGWLVGGVRPAAESYNEWAAGRFSPEERAAGSAAAYADPHRCGRANLLAYALGTPAAGPGRPELTIAAPAGTVVIPAPAERPDVVLRVECSADMITWATAADVVREGGCLRCVLPAGMRFVRLAATPADGAVIDVDGDGLHDSFEEAMAAANPNDGCRQLGDFGPLDDFDGDGIPNVLEAANHAANAGGSPGPALIDPQWVGRAVDALPGHNPPALEVHTPLE
jgi:hypothetical protein